MDYLNQTLPFQAKAFTTNGISLNETICQKLTDGRYDVMISMHAANAQLHEKMTRTKKFNEIVNNIKRLVQLKKEKNSKISINMVFVVTQDNIGNLCDFIKFSKDLQTDCVSANYLTMYEKEHVDMSVFWNKEKNSASPDYCQFFYPDFVNRKNRIYKNHHHYYCSLCGNDKNKEWVGG